MFNGNGKKLKEARRELKEVLIKFDELIAELKDNIKTKDNIKQETK